MTVAKKWPGTEPPKSERELLKATGISRAFAWRAKQVASMDAAEFEALVESDKPPTVTQLVAIARGKGEKRKRRTHCPHCGDDLNTTSARRDDARPSNRDRAPPDRG